MQGTELNPDFFSDIVAAVSKELGAVLLCNIGGRIDVTDTNPAGTQSRSHQFPLHIIAMPASSVFGEQRNQLVCICLCILQESLGCACSSFRSCA